MAEKAIVRPKYEHLNLEGAVGEFPSEEAALWDALAGKTQIDRIQPALSVKEKTSFFCYFDITLVVPLGGGLEFPLKLRGLQAKSIKGVPAIGMASEKGSNDLWYEHFMPRSAAGRSVLTSLVFSDPDIQKIIEQAIPIEQEKGYVVTGSVADTGTPAPSAAPVKPDTNPFAKAAEAAAEA